MLARGELVRFAYELGRSEASGVWTVSARTSRASALDGTRPSRGEVFVLRRGCVVVGDADTAKHAVVQRLVRLAGQDDLIALFEGDVVAYPPGASHQIGLAAWARDHLERQVDSTLADHLVRQLAGVRVALRPELAPAPNDEADRRMIAAMLSPRRLDQIWPIARTPRFRLLAFLHFLRAVDALEVEGIVADQSGPHYQLDPRRVSALRTLGVDASADLEAVKRAYRKLARSYHPDLQPDADLDRRRHLERRFAEVTAAYEALL